MKIYGALERVQIFTKNNVRFAYATYKSDRSALLAIMQLNSELSDKLCNAKLADAYKQPDNALDETQSPFQNLARDCLIQIFQYCNIYDQAALTNVCQNFNEIIKDFIWKNTKKMEFSGSDIKHDLKILDNILKGIGTSEVYFEMFRPQFQQCGHEIIINIDWNKSIIHIDPYYLEHIYDSNIICDRFTELIIDYRERYDKLLSPPTINEEFFTNIKKVTIIGRCNRLPMPKIMLNELESISTIKYINWSFCPWDYANPSNIFSTDVMVYDVNFIFENCSFHGPTLVKFLDQIYSMNSEKIFFKIIKGEFNEDTHRIAGYNNGYNKLKEDLADLNQVGKRIFNLELLAIILLLF